MGKRLNKVKAFCKKHWKEMTLTGAGVTVAAGALYYVKEHGVVVSETTVKRTVAAKDYIPTPEGLVKYGVNCVGDYSTSLEMMTDDNSIPLSELGNFGKDLCDEIPVISPESRAFILINIKKTEE